MKGTGSKLRAIFDLQRFEEEPKLQGVINDTLKASKRFKKLSDDELEFAAGGQNTEDGSILGTVDMICPHCSKDPKTQEETKRTVDIYKGAKGLCRNCHQWINGI
ncbi:MAG: hypothetical protein K5668_09365 [Lachnospiraceae bacterium]|nr:hypothetical protein [Lachnospiraceae bacterium]